jgi:hypothetical protein
MNHISTGLGRFEGTQTVRSRPKARRDSNAGTPEDKSGPRLLVTEPTPTAIYLNLRRLPKSLPLPV